MVNKALAVSLAFLLIPSPVFAQINIEIVDVAEEVGIEKQKSEELFINDSSWLKFNFTWKRGRFAFN